MRTTLMSNVDQMFDRALQQHKAGNLPAAEQLYREVLQTRPRHIDAHNMLGLIACQSGRHAAAEDYLREALRLNPRLAEAHANLGMALAAQGKLDEAVASYRQAIRLKPQSFVAHNNLGTALRAQGKLDEAVASWQRAVRLKPDFAEAHGNLGLAWLAKREPAQAVANLQRALRFDARSPELHCNLGLAWKQQGKLAEAEASYRETLRLRPDFADAHYQLAHALAEQGRLQDAVVSFGSALELQPNNAAAHYHRGHALRELARLDEAIAAWQEAVRLRPDFAEAHNDAGVALLARGRPAEALVNLRQAVQARPDYADAYSNLGAACKDLGLLSEALSAFQAAARLKPQDAAALGDYVHELQQACQWADLAPLARRVLDLVEREASAGTAPISPFAFFALPIATTAAQQLECGRRWTQCQTRPAAAAGGANLPRPAGTKTKITLGYVSADFHAHATAYLIAELLEKHDRQRFEVFGYSYGPDDGSQMRRRLAGALDRLVDVRDLAPAEAARRIAADGVDILVDLKGHSRGARTQIFALRPAPVQVNYLGYPGTMGASFMDYILVDDFIVPPDQQPFFSEQLVHLPGCYQANDGQREISTHTPSRAQCGLPQHGFVFCCFNNSYKITAEMFDVWMGLLQAVPGSVLWLLEMNGLAPANLRREAMARGIAPERLVFAPRVDLPHHLARHRLADLFLDCFPVNAHTTASDALWAGCPVLTLAGRTFVSRVAGSLLRTLGLAELVTTSLDEYAALALRLARDGALLAELRGKLAAGRRQSRLFDATAFTRSLERAYLRMIEIQASGEPPRAFAMSLD